MKKFSDLKNPIFEQTYSVRDPAAIYVHNQFHLFFTCVRRIGRDYRYYVGTCQTHDFKKYSRVEFITPEGYASPGNVIYHNGEWVLCCQSYRCLPGKLVAGDDCRLFLMYSKDLKNWSKPQIISAEGAKSK